MRRNYYIRRFRLIRGLLLICLGYWFGCVWKNGYDDDDDENASFNSIHIGFLTDGQNLADMNKGYQNIVSSSSTI